MANELDIIYNGASANLYAIVRRESDGYAWDVTNSAFEAWDNASIGDYDIVLTDNGGDWYAANFPTSITAGQYRVTYYERAGASPATTDEPLKNESLYWNGSTVSSSPSSDYLTTLAKVKLYLGITGSGDDTLLTNLLGAASRFIEGYLDTKVLADSYTEYQHGSGTPYLKLDNKWVTQVSRVATEPETVMEIRNTSTAQRAYVQVSSTGLTAVSTDGASSTTNTFAFATYTTLSSLKTAVEGVSGWSVSVTGGYESLASSNLREIQYASASGGSSAELEAYVSELSWSRIDFDTGTVKGYFFPEGFRNIEVKYSAGYASDAVPDDIQQACAALTAGLYRIAKSGSGGNLKREKIGDYEYERFPTAMTAANLSTVSFDAFLLLARHRNVPCL